MELLTRNQLALLRQLANMNNNIMALESNERGWCLNCDTEYSLSALLKVATCNDAKCPKCKTKTILPMGRSLTKKRKLEVQKLVKAVKQNQFNYKG